MNEIVQKEGVRQMHPVNEPELQLAKLEQKIVELTNQLLHSEKLASIGQLAAGVAHEINNPIGYVASNMKMLTDYSQSLIEMIEELTAGMPDEQKNQLFEKYDFNFLKQDVPVLAHESEEGLERVIEIIRDLKDFSHIEEAEFVLVNLHQGILSTLNIVSKELKYKAEIIKDLADLPPIECMPSQINQVVMNLLMNAAQAIEDQGEICISTGQHDDWVWFSVRDNGKGIETEQQELIFEPFFTTKPKGQGTGLGLALSRSIIDKHNGRIEVESQLGKGSCFKVWLPVSQKNLV
jgi:two-component system NtrC family sensor kinase